MLRLGPCRIENGKSALPRNSAHVIHANHCIYTRTGSSSIPRVRGSKYLNVMVVGTTSHYGYSTWGLIFLHVGLGKGQSKTNEEYELWSMSRIVGTSSGQTYDSLEGFYCCLVEAVTGDSRSFGVPEALTVASMLLV